MNEIHREIVKSLPYFYYVIEVDSFIVTESNDPNFTVNKHCSNLIFSNSDNCLIKSRSKCSVTRVLEEKKSIKTKLSNVNIMGETKCIWVHASPIFNSDQKITHVIEYLIEITEQEIFLEEANSDLSNLNIQLKETTNKYKSLFENSPESLWEEDFTILMQSIENLKSQGITNFRSYFDEHPEVLMELTQQVIIVDVNQATINLYKAKSKEDLIGNLAKTFLPESLAVFKEELLAIIDGKNDFAKEAKVKTLEGEVVEVIIKLFYTKNGDKYTAYVSTTDITARKKSDIALKQKNDEFLQLNAELESANKEYETLNEEYKTINSEILKTNIELEKAKEKAIESDQLKSAFLANMSHEIRTPMNTIIGFSDLLGEPNISTERRHKFLKLIQSSSEHLLRIIDDIIDVSKLESNQLKINKKSCPLNELLYEIKESQSMIKIVKAKNNIRLQLNIPKNTENINISCDPTRFRQILYNLVSNAFKYTKEGSVEIGYSISDVDSMIHLYVKDTGFGIQPEMFQLIFERFRQIENQNLQEGTGIGLSITKGLVHLLGGEIWIESKLDEGSTFHFTIPISEESKPIIAENITQHEPNKINLSRCLVYIAEDDISSFLLLEELLEFTGVRLKHAVNGKELINLINSQIPDLILLDINMPIMNGFEAIDKIRATYPNIPVIAQTAYAMAEEREKCISVGCNDYISKPINAQLLLKKIRQYLTCYNN
jgi:signal transduction histidine kinase/CheY-like chemotaxis protein